MTATLKVLIIEDSANDAAMVVRLLRRANYDVRDRRVETAGEMRAALEEQAWDIVISDHSLPQFNARATLALLHETGLDIPFIVVSGTIGEETAVECMRAGAGDYVMKGNLGRLVPAVDRELREAARRREKEKVEALLKESEKKSSRVFQNAPVPMAIALTEDGRLLDVNEEYLRITEYPREELIGHRAVDLKLWVKPEERSEHIRAIKKTSGRVQGRPCTLRTKSGKIVDMLFSAEIMDIGGVSCLVSSAVDITERKRYENEIRELSLMNQRILNSAGEGIFGLDPAGQITFVNPAGAEALQYGVRELIGQQSHDLFHHTRPDGTPHRMEECPILRTLKKGAVHRSSDDVFWRRDGTGLPVEYSCTPIAEHGGIIGAVVAFRDTTERMQSLEKLRKALGASVQTIARVVERRDPYTAGHQRRVADLARAVAAEMGLSEDRIDGLHMAAIIHDIGKISIPAEILSKPTRLTAVEFSLIRVHPEAGYEILKDIDLPWPVARMILEHHERMDGSGYPRGLRVEEILPESRILQVADVVESIASHRPYRPALGIDAALAEIENHRGILYDAQAVDACMRVFRERGFRFEEP